MFGTKDDVYLHIWAHTSGCQVGGPFSYDITSILRCFVTRTQTHAHTYYPTNFCITSKNRVQKGSKWKTIHASILRLLQNERRLYVEHVSHRLTVEQGHFVWRSRRGRPGYSVWIYLYEVSKLLWVEECPTYSHACRRFTTEEVWWLTNISAVPLICSGGIQTVLSRFTFTRTCICSHCWLGWNMAGCYRDNAVRETPMWAQITAEPAAA